MTVERWWNPGAAFDHPVTVVIVVGVVAALLVAPLVIVALRSAGRIDADHYGELMARTRSWAVICLALGAPILIAPNLTIVLVLVLSLACYREYARGTGLFRHHAISAFVVIGIVLVHFAAMDNWYGLFVALPPLVVSAIAVVALTTDQPSGYIQRTALGIFAFALFGAGLGHLAFAANDEQYRPLLLWLIVCVEANDIFAYCGGKLFGRTKLAPRTSPGKTVAGAVTAVVATIALTMTIGHFLFAGTRLAHPLHTFALGLIISVIGQCGDLMLSSIKRDLGAKDMSSVIPGHGGLLDRFDSLLLVAPAVYHFVHYLHGIANGVAERLITASP